MSTADEKATAFLNEGPRFRLGILPTEHSHPLTKDLAHWSKHDLPRAYSALHAVDRQALQSLIPNLDSWTRVEKLMADTLESGGRLFFVGCGATGRLSLSLEALWRQMVIAQGPTAAAWLDRVISFMAGGDVALVHALEGFEDFPEYGARQLEALGFSENDLLIASTEGGETPFVIGATERAAQISKRTPVFAYCNPTSILKENIERSRKVLENPRIVPFELAVGPMALTGSTRMQASTVLMLALGVCLMRAQNVLGSQKSRSAKDDLTQFIDLFESINFAGLAPLTVHEAEVYQAGGSILYECDEFALTVFTDTTERAPTFSLAAFDNQLYPKSSTSLAYISLPSTQTGADSWHRLLGRPPRSLNWVDINDKTSDRYLSGFDFSKEALRFRTQLLKREPVRFKIDPADQAIVMQIAEHSFRWSRAPSNILFDHLLLKIALNMHSTLIMGRMERFEGNFMTWVYPTNGKLIDRATRYILLWLERENKVVPYEKAVRQLFKELETLQPNESIVLKTARRLRSQL
jgi:N-acetylmuramic acid 6-phosphate etherase